MLYALRLAAVFCPEAEVPQFKAGTQPGSTNLEQVKQDDPEYWNAYQRRIEYTCPRYFDTVPR